MIPEALIVQFIMRVCINSRAVKVGFLFTVIEFCENTLRFEEQIYEW